MQEILSPYCELYERAVEILGRRWTGQIVRALMAGLTRFGEIKAVVPGLSDRLLSERLKDLEAEGIVVREVTPDTPVRIDYRLTEKGQALRPVVGAFADWADTWLAPASSARR